VILLDPDTPNLFYCLLCTTEFRGPRPTEKSTERKDEKADPMTGRSIFLELPDKMQENLVNGI